MDGVAVLLERAKNRGLELSVGSDKRLLVKGISKANEEIAREIESQRDLIVQAINGEPSGATVHRLRGMVQKYQHLKPPIIHGLLRQGETCNIIAPPKRGKSWLVNGLAIAMVCGEKWLQAFDCEPRSVLIIDNELHIETITFRLKEVAAAMGVPIEQVWDDIDVISLRGQLVDLNQLQTTVDHLERGRYGAVIGDSLYRFYPSGMSENDNAAVMSLYNRIDSYAASLETSWINIHHSSRGGQGEKAVTDVGAGAGSQSRAADTHIVMRQHEEEGVVVLEAAVRSFPPVEPLPLQWVFPLWYPVEGVDCSKLKGRMTAAQRKKHEETQADVEKLVRAIIEEGYITMNGACDVLACGHHKAKRILATAVNDGRLLKTAKDLPRNPQTEAYVLANP